MKHFRFVQMIYQLFMLILNKYKYKGVGEKTIEQ